MVSDWAGLRAQAYQAKVVNDLSDQPVQLGILRRREPAIIGRIEMPLGCDALAPVAHGRRPARSAWRVCQLLAIAQRTRVCRRSCPMRYTSAQRLTDSACGACHRGAVVDRAPPCKTPAQTHSVPARPACARE